MKQPKTSINGMKMATMDQTEFGEFLDSVSWLRECQIIWRGQGALQMAKAEGEPGKEKVTEIRIEPGQEIEPIEIAFMIYSYIKGGYQLADGNNEPGEAVALATATLLNERAKQMAFGKDHTRGK